MNYWSRVGIPNVRTKEIILEKVCEVFDVTKQDVIGISRLRYIVDAKTAICYILRVQNNMTITSIGEYLKLHHASVLHHCTKAKQLIETDKEFLNKMKQLNVII